MSMSPPEMTPEQMQPQKRGMSTGAKVLIALGIVFLVLFVLCCGGVFLVGYLGVSYFGETISQDPAKIATVTDEITQIEIPEGLSPQMSMDMKIPFTDQRIMVMAVYADEPSNSTLVLMAMGEQFAGQNEAQMKQSAEQQLRQQGMQQEEVLIEESYQKEVEIRGEQATFNILKGRGAESQAARIQVTGVFRGEDGPVMLILNADATKFGEQQVIEMIDSIR